MNQQPTVYFSIILFKYAATHQFLKYNKLLPKLHSCMMHAFCLTPEQLEDSFKIWAKYQAPIGLFNATLIQQNVKNSPRIYQFTHNNTHKKTFLFQPIRFSKSENDTNQLEQAVTFYQSQLKQTGASQIIIPLMQITPIVHDLSVSHFVTLKLEVDPSTGTILSGEVFDAKNNYPASEAFDKEIETSLKNIVRNNNFKFKGRSHLGIQSDYKVKDSGIYANLTCKALLEKQTVTKSDLTIQNNIDQVIRSEVKNSDIHTVQNSVFDFSQNNQIPVQAQETLVLPIQDKIETQLHFPDGQTLADSIQLNLQETTVQDKPNFISECNACCLDEQMHGELPTELRTWMVHQGNSILQKLYGLENLDFDNIEAILKTLGIRNLIENSGIIKDKLYEKIFHHSPITDWFSPRSLVEAAKRRFKGESAREKNRKDFLMGIVCVMWSLYNQAAIQGDFFERGSFKIIDAQDKLFYLLKKYVQYATGQKKPTYLNGSDFAYSRDPKSKKSSHYKEPEFKAEQYGIDMRLWSGTPNIKILPHKTAHLLCGQIEINEKKYTMVKFERIGLGNVLEFMEHGMHFINPETRSKHVRREKDIPQALQDIYNDYQKFYYKLTGETPQAKSIGQMYQQIFAARDFSAKFGQLFRNFSHELQQKRMLEHVEIRTGNEVILDFGSFLSSQKLEEIEKVFSKYVNQFHPNASIFADNVKAQKIKHSKKYAGRPSLADNLEKVSLADFISKAYPYPSIPNSRDQLVIDVIHESKNGDPLVQNFIDGFAALNSMRGLQDQYYARLFEFKNEPNVHELMQPLLQSYSQYKHNLMQALIQTADPKLIALAATFDRFSPQSNAVNVSIPDQVQNSTEPTATTSVKKADPKQSKNLNLSLKELESLALLGHYGFEANKIENNLLKVYKNKVAEKGGKWLLQSFKTHVGISKHRKSQIKDLAITLHALQNNDRLAPLEKGILLQAHLHLLNQSLARERKRLGSRLLSITQDMEEKLQALTEFSMSQTKAINLSEAYKAFERGEDVAIKNVLTSNFPPKNPNYKPQ